MPLKRLFLIWRVSRFEPLSAIGVRLHKKKGSLVLLVYIPPLRRMAPYSYFINKSRHYLLLCGYLLMRIV